MEELNASKEVSWRGSQNERNRNIAPCVVFHKHGVLVSGRCGTLKVKENSNNI